eukprot:jgi/Mesvir1/14697/Mv05354-RA.1
MQEAQPQNPAAPYEDWMARFMPVDSSLGEPLYPGPVPAVPFLRYNSLDHHVEGRRQPPGTIHWWTGPIRTDTGEFLMHYVAVTSLVAVLDASDMSGAPPIDNGTLVAGVDSSTLAVEAPQAVGAVGIAYSTRSLTKSLQQIDLRGGRLFLSRALGGLLVLANQGRLFVPAEGAEDPLTITAEQSDDPIIAAAARHLRQTFSEGNDTWEAHDGVQQKHRHHAMAAGLCWEKYEATCEGKVYGGDNSNLCMVAVLLVPRDAIMGRVDASNDRSLAIVMGVTAAILVLGMAFVYFSTVHVGRMARKKEELEGQVEKQEGEIKSMAEELDAMRALLPRGSQNALDLRTPMEKVHDLLAELAVASGGPGSDALATVQKLLRMPEIHMPIVLQQRMGRGTLESSALPGQPAGQDLQVRSLGA